MHQKSCRVVLALNDELRVDLNDITLTDQEHGNRSVLLITSGAPSLKPGDYGFSGVEKGKKIYLNQTTNGQRPTANEYFKLVLFF